jgi:hypothetical protein
MKAAGGKTHIGLAIKLMTWLVLVVSDVFNLVPMVDDGK